MSSPQLCLWRRRLRGTGQVSPPPAGVRASAGRGLSRGPPVPGVGCADSSSSGGPASPASPEAPVSSVAPGQVVLAPGSATPITITAVEVPSSEGQVTDMVWTAAASSAPTADGFVTLTGKVSTTADCGSPEPTTVSVISPAGDVLVETQFELPRSWAAESAMASWSSGSGSTARPARLLVAQGRLPGPADCPDSPLPRTRTPRTRAAR